MNFLSGNVYCTVTLLHSADPAAPCFQAAQRHIFHFFCCIKTVSGDNAFIIFISADQRSDRYIRGHFFRHPVIHSRKDTRRSSGHLFCQCCQCLKSHHQIFFMRCFIDHCSLFDGQDNARRRCCRHIFLNINFLIGYKYSALRAGQFHCCSHARHNSGRIRVKQHIHFTFCIRIIKRPDNTALYIRQCSKSFFQRCLIQLRRKRQCIRLIP